MPYLTNAEFLQRFDARLVGDLCQDVNNRLSSGALETNTILTTVLTDASGVVESACFVGQRYSSADLTGLPTNSAGLLKRLVADIAINLLCQRRGYSYKDKFPLVEESMKLLDRIRLGERIFDVEDDAKAGNTQTTTISLATLLQQNPTSTQFHYFPQKNPEQYS